MWVGVVVNSLLCSQGILSSYFGYCPSSLKATLYIIIRSGKRDYLAGDNNRATGLSITETDKYHFL